MASMKNIPQWFLFNQFIAVSESLWRNLSPAPNNSSTKGRDRRKELCRRWCSPKVCSTTENEIIFVIVPDKSVKKKKQKYIIRSERAHRWFIDFLSSRRRNQWATMFGQTTIANVLLLPAIIELWNATNHFRDAYSGVEKNQRHQTWFRKRETAISLAGSVLATRNTFSTQIAEAVSTTNKNRSRIWMEHKILVGLSLLRPLRAG